MTLQQMPKVELHTHLEGSAPPDLVRDMARQKSIDIGGIFDEQGNYAYRDFPHFLEVYEAATSVLQSPEDFHRLTLAVLEQAADHGVIYCETFLSPDFCGGRDVAAWREYLHAIQEAAAQAERQMGITLRGIVTCIRHFGPDKARQTALCAAETAGDFITGFGMGGNEMLGSQGDFAWSFDMAREAGLRLTTHAGEWGGAQSVRQAIDDLRVERIGHGVQSIQDPDLVQELAEREIVLEVCPLSNVALGLYATVAENPIARLHDAGVKVTVSTDDPPFFHTTMTREYEMLHRAFGWDKAMLTELNKQAIRAAFCDAATRDRILEKLETP